ncbi:hypothetical protein NA57DRAFT_81229 [Rhizodiscina lignyota]|uniref:C2H2-type domain-containing protein n=1 Tax=Rhizodiscina lignyota TaxID=1504668 RepID=A0A9P4I6A7_9PEZI|nr:hypothetical protein NA57DRAFT_81229 [Rhizodiscina lignyota]
MSNSNWEGYVDPNELIDSLHFTTSGDYSTASTPNAAFVFPNHSAYATNAYNNPGYTSVAGGFASNSSYQDSNTYATIPQYGQPQQALGGSQHAANLSTYLKQQIEAYYTACKEIVEDHEDEIDHKTIDSLETWTQVEPHYTEGTDEYNQAAAGYLNWYKQLNSTLYERFNSNDGNDEGATEAQGADSAARKEAGKGSKEKKIFPCPYPDCDSAPSRKADLQRHIEAVHEKNANLYCTDPACNRSNKPGGKGFSRRDHLHEHYRSVHNMTNEYPKKQTGKKEKHEKPEKKRKH